MDRSETRRVQEIEAFLKDDYKELYDRMLALLTAFCNKSSDYSKPPHLAEMAELLDEFLATTIFGDAFAAAQDAAMEDGYEITPYEHPLALEARMARNDRILARAEGETPIMALLKPLLEGHIKKLRPVPTNPATTGEN